MKGFSCLAITSLLGATGILQERDETGEQKGEKKKKGSGRIIGIFYGG